MNNEVNNQSEEGLSTVEVLNLRNVKAVAEYAKINRKRTEDLEMALEVVNRNTQVLNSQVEELRNQVIAMRAQILGGGPTAS